MDIAGLATLLNNMRQIDKDSTYVCAWDIDDSVVSDKDIGEIELELGFDLCDSYEIFLKSWGHIITSDLVIVGMFRDEGRLVSPFLKTTKSFSEKYLGGNFGCRTVIGITEDEEWFYLLDHESSQVTPFDPFSKTFVESMSLSFEEFLFRELSDILVVLKE